MLLQSGLEEPVFLRRRKPGIVELLRVARVRFLVVFPPLLIALICVLLFEVASGRARTSFSLTGKTAADRLAILMLVLAIVTWVVLVVREWLSLLLEHRERAVRVSMHEIECWVGGQRRYVRMGDVLGGVVKPPDKVRSGPTIFHPLVPTSRLYLTGADSISSLDLPLIGYGEVSASGRPSETDGNAAFVDAVGAMWKRRRKQKLPVALASLPPIVAESQTGVHFEADDETLSVTVKGRATPVPGWAVRGLRVEKPPDEGMWSRRTVKLLILELDPRCGVPKLAVELASDPADDQILERCLVMTARFAREPVSSTHSRGGLPGE